MGIKISMRVVPVIAYLCWTSLFVSPVLAEEKPWAVELKTKVMFNSHTSYEFGNPMPPCGSPLSRLEFPMASFWTGLEARRKIGRVSIGLEFLSSMVDQEADPMVDKDWYDNPNQLFIRSELKNIMLPSFQLGGDVDVQIADALNLPSAFDVRPLVGFSWQQLSFITSDFVMKYYAEDGSLIFEDFGKGNAIAFEQNWYQFIVGARFGYEFRNPPILHPLKFYSQLDWRYVRGRNLDRHYLRPGNRQSKENTTGDAFHAVAGAQVPLNESLNLKLEFEYLRISTTGSHKLMDDMFGTEVWTHGVKVWSEQRSINLNLEYRF